MNYHILSLKEGRMKEGRMKEGRMKEGKDNEIDWKGRIMSKVDNYNS